jgi:hypothetical protein
MPRRVKGGAVRIAVFATGFLFLTIKTVSIMMTAE